MLLARLRSSIPVAIALLGLAAWAPKQCCGANLLLRWLTVPEAEGYRLYVGQETRRYVAVYELGPVAAKTIDGIGHFLVRGLQPDQPYFFALTAYNRAGESDFSNEKRVVLSEAAPPLAQAGPDQTGVVGQKFHIGGDSENAHHVWLQEAGPPVELANLTGSETTFTPQSAGTFEFTLVAYDVDGVASADQVRIKVLATAPALSWPTRLLAIVIFAFLGWRSLTPERKGRLLHLIPSH